MSRKHKGTAAALGICLAAAITVQAGAVAPSDVAGIAAGTAARALRQSLPQQSQTIGFNGLETRVRAGNTTIQSFQKTLAGIANTDIDAQFDAQEMQYALQVQLYEGQVQSYQSAIDALQSALSGDLDDATRTALNAQIKAMNASLTIANMNLKTNQGILDSLDDAREDAQDELDETYASTKKQLDQAADQIVMGAQSAYIGLVTLQNGLDTLDRNLAALDRNVAVVEKQVEIGMASELTLTNLQQTRRTLAAQRETMVQQQWTAESQLSLLIGGAANTTVQVNELPEVSSSKLGSISYEKDLEKALENSYSIWEKQDAVRKAGNDYEDDVTSTVDAFEAAKLNLEAERQNVTNTVRRLYLDLQDKARLVEEAQAAYDTQKKNFDVSALQYERGMISKLDYQTAQDDLAAKEDEVKTAQINLFTAYNTYDWAIRGVTSAG